MMRFDSRGIAAGVVGAVLVVGALAGGAVRAEDDVTRAQSPTECQLFADIAIVARALVENKISEGQQRPVLDAIYQPDNNRAHSVVGAILDGARRAVDPAPNWANALSKYCIQRSGNIKEFLGSAI